MNFKPTQTHFLPACVIDYVRAGTLTVSSILPGTKRKQMNGRLQISGCLWSTVNLGKKILKRFGEKLVEEKENTAYSILKLTERLELRRITDKLGKSARQNLSSSFYKQDANLRMKVCNRNAQ